MKLLRLVVLFVSAVLAARAADFEGTLRWTFAIEITDPALKQQMAEAEKRLADPATQAQMKQAQEALKDPQMQAMMAQNPQMKAMLEQQLAAMQQPAAGGGGPLANMFPKAVTVRTKAGKSLSVMEGGAVPMEVLNLPAEPASYLINRPARSFSKVPAEKPAADGAAGAPTYQVTKTNETIKVLGYTATKYVVEVKAATAAAEAKAGGPTRYLVWASSEVPGLGGGALARMRFSQGGADNAFLKEIAGVPLKMEMSTPQARVTMQATSIQAEKLADSVFTVPAGFVERPLAAGF